MPNYIDDNRCWITNTGYIDETTQRLFTNELEVVGFHKNCVHLKDRINELLSKKTEGYIRQPMQFNDIYKTMEIIISNILCLKSDTVQKDIFTGEFEMYSLREPRTGKHIYISF